MTEVGIRSTPVEDLYLILSAMDDMNGALSATPRPRASTSRSW